MGSAGVKATGRALLFLFVSVMAGCLVAGLALTPVAATAVGARAAGRLLPKLSLSLREPPQAQRSTLLAANGRVIGHFYDQNRVSVPLDRIAPIMQRALIAIEDDRYYSHGALDVRGTIRALVADLATGSTVQGGSTLTQQYVKLVLVNKAVLAGDQAAVQRATADTLARKITELRYALSVEHRLSKNQILQRYLNIAYFGDGAYGVEAAAEHYFGTTAANLTLPEAAMLAGLVQSPYAYDPVVHPFAGIGRRDEVLNRMAELGVITRRSAIAAERAGFDQHRVVPMSSGCQGSPYPFVCDYARRSLLQLPSLGSTPAARAKLVDRGGLTIRTTLDVTAQHAAQHAIRTIIGPKDPLIATTDIVQPGTGKIIAMAQSRPVMGSARGHTYYNYSAPADLGGSQGFQAGSTFKAFTAAAAFEQGIPMTHLIDASATRTYTGTRFPTCSGHSVITNWTVSNSTGVNGTMTMLTGTVDSVNNYFVQLELQVGMCNVIKMAQRLGVQTNTPLAPIGSYDNKPSFTLGTPEVSPLSMAGAYATFASGGIHCTPVIIDKITTGTGAQLDGPDADCRRVISPGVAAAVDYLFRHVMAVGTGLPARTLDPRPEAGKTGTIDSNAAVWFNGFTPNAETVSMIAVDNTRTPFRKGGPGYISTGLKYYTVPSTGVLLSGTGGGDAGHDLWRPTMQAYLSSLPVEHFGPTPAALIGGHQQRPTGPPGRGRFGPGPLGPGQRGLGQRGLGQRGFGQPGAVHPGNTFGRGR
ncbi:MAG: transglycosylase domain-containing protein [Microlunatus sp.]|nr:transglycosylase domain-containing protein [Microlunatus sp.]